MLLLATDSLKGYGLNRIFMFTKDAGFDGVELALENNDFDTQNVPYIKELIDEVGIPVVAVRTFPNSTIKKSIFACDLAKKVGASYVIVEPPKLFDFKYAEWLKKDVPTLRKKYGVKIALKNSSAETLLGFLPGRSMSNITDLKKFGQVCLDTALLYSKKADLIRTYNVLKKMLVYIHFSNVEKGQIHCLPQHGVLPLESLLTHLKRDKYNNPISIIVKPAKLHVGHEKKMMETLASIKDFCEQYYSK